MRIARAIFLICIDPEEASIDEEDGSVIVIIKEKTDEGGKQIDAPHQEKERP
jgi:hypothetical protein